jgi:hypothetical protein
LEWHFINGTKQQKTLTMQKYPSDVPLESVWNLHMMIACYDHFSCYSVFSLFLFPMLFAVWLLMTVLYLAMLLGFRNLYILYYNMFNLRIAHVLSIIVNDSLHLHATLFCFLSSPVLVHMNLSVYPIACFDFWDIEFGWEELTR